MVSELIARGAQRVKEETEALLRGESITTYLDEQISFSQLYTKEGAIWSLLMAAGYVKPLTYDSETKIYEITITNYESLCILEEIISGWFYEVGNIKKNFQHALLHDDLEEMNELMNDIATSTFSFFDTGKNKKYGPENFYHAFVLGLLVDLKNLYDIRSNRESGLGRYDVCMIPQRPGDRGIIIEFKTMKHKHEADLKETCANALQQIRDKNYINELLTRNVDTNNIYIYGIAFSGKRVVICGGAIDSVSSPV